MRINYMTGIQDRIGMASEDIELPAAVQTARDLIAWLAARNDRFKNVFGTSTLIHVAADDRLLAADDAIGGCRNLTFFSPIVGG